MSQRLKILNIVGARPNLPKIAPLMHEMQRHPEIDAILVHTGQHYDEKLSDIFFRQMGIPSPHVNLEVGSGSHAWQTAEILKRIEPVLVERKPDLVLVVGDVNSTIAVSLAASDTLAGRGKAGRIPPLWDRHAARRIVDILLREVPRNHAS
jgi:UDP-N-acetylglucosamine 2-epimerase (non-hydrolysing)